jgi:hypothetical protein
MKNMIIGGVIFGENIMHPARSVFHPGKNFIMLQRSTPALDTQKTAQTHSRA